jgi:hypothetical protein
VRKAPLLRCVGALLALSCGPNRTQQIHPQLVPPASSFDFGKVPVLNVKTLDIPLQNVGRAELTVASAVIKESGVPFTVQQSPTSVESGATASVTVAFVPPAEQAYQGTLEVTTDDSVNPVVDVALTGTGSTRAIMVVTPASIDFGRVPEGTSALRSITVSSQGSAALIVNQIDLMPTSASGFGFLGSIATPAVVDSGTDIQITVKYFAAPGSTDGGTGMMEVHGTDPQNQLATVALTAELNRAPIPVIAPLGNGAPGIVVTLDGSGSYDPDNDLPLTYQWTLVNAPLSATTTIANPTAEVTQMTLDSLLPGEYDVTLDVTDHAGAKDLHPAKATIVAIPAQKLLIEMFQDNPDTDLDLHLLRTQTSALGGIPDDCFYANQTPDWLDGGTADGGSDGGSDGPVLYRDVLTGYGPEVTGYDNPIDSTFRIAVVFFNDHLSTTPATKATVRIYEYGVEKAELSRVLQNQGDFWLAADLNWPTGTVTPLP